MAKAKQMVTRIVQGPKGWGAIDKDGNRYHAVEGETVMVSANSAKLFPERLVSPNVLKANAEAAQVAYDAAREAEKPTEEATEEAKETPKVEVAAKVGYPMANPKANKAPGSN